MIGVTEPEAEESSSSANYIQSFRMPTRRNVDVVTLRGYATFSAAALITLMLRISRSPKGALASHSSTLITCFEADAGEGWRGRGTGVWPFRCGLFEVMEVAEFVCITSSNAHNALIFVPSFSESRASVE